MSETGDGLDHLRIPFEKIKFGKKLEVQGYGTVFEGEFDDQRVALKLLNITNLASIKPKLLAEILTISRFRQHPNLVALLGFCDEKSNGIILVYEYVASGNLADKMRKRLNTIQRFEICLGAARGLDYLHTGVDSGIVHGNIKLSKILLNSDANSSKFEAKVSSFGLSKIVPGKAQESSDEVTKPTKESDVYSFGVLLFEVLCGVSELVDTDDYQERHVTELVPKKMAQNKLQKVVHFDIRKEIKPEALETYAKIACQCVMENPDARPHMAQVVEELEKALRLQGGEVKFVQIRGSSNIAGPEDGSKDDGSDVTLESDILGEEPENDNIIPTIEEDAKDLTVGEKSDDAGKVNGEEVNIIDTISESTNTETEPNKTHIEDAQIENSNDDPVTEREILNESNITVENKEDASKEISTIDPVTTEETINDFDSDKKSNIIEEDKEDEESMEITTTSESSKGDTSTLTNQEVDESEILKSDIKDELEHLRIPFEKIKFGQKVDVHGYGTMFEGEFDHQQVALKRLNITNLGNIKPKFLSAIITISRFRKHPNLVALIGFCDENDKEIILVYEYVSGGNLADNMSKHLTTIQRLQICLGAARGIEYLHSGVESVDSNPGIIHGDLKLSKILLNPDSNSLNFEAKVSGFGLPKLLPGHVEIRPKSMDPVHAATGKLTKESDVYAFGVLLLEVLCGVPELVDTDDYQERHVTELIPKKLEQNMLRKIVYFDIRNEITTESLETYAKNACRCVMKNPEDRPTMSEVVVELEKALKLQDRKVSDVQIIGSSNGNDLAEVPIGEDDHAGDANGEMISSNITEEESKVVEETIDDTNLLGKSFPVPISDSNDVESVQEDAETKDVRKERNTIYPETIDDFESNKESKITVENKEDDKSIDITTASESSNGGNTSTSTGQEVQESEILKSGIKDELEHLRIPFEKIKFGQKIDVNGYGTMFEGEFDHQQVSLKRLNITNVGNIKPKLLSAILTISRIRKHPNLVALIGFCDENDKQIILVYEYVSGGNLADNISKHLTTIQRLQICLGAARGLEYLHSGDESVDSNPVIIHGDLKLSKILLNSDSFSSNFEAKVSGFGLPKLLPGHVEIRPKSMDPVHAATGKLTKESDVYTFGVLLLEVLCGVPELVDTDDYQESHVTELVPKRLEQNMLRKIVHFDIRNEITTESLEMYAKIACRCVMKNPEERPNMSEVVIELEKALKLQGGKASDVQIVGSSNGNSLAEVPVGEDDHAGDDNGETISSDITEEESKVVEETIDDTNLLGESFPVPVSDSKDVESVPEDAETKNGDNLNDPESTEEITADLKSNEESKISVENEASNESNITTPLSISEYSDHINSAMDGNVSDVQLLDSSNGSGLPQVSVGEDDQEGDNNGETISSNTKEEESKVIEETTGDIALVDAEKESGDNMNDPEEITVGLKSTEESKTNEENEVDPHNKEIMDSAVLDGDTKAGLLNAEKPELVVNIRGDFSNSVTQTKESESKRSNSTCSESSNGDDTTPSDLLLPKSPVDVTKTSKGSRNCCSCSWWQYICSRVVFYGGLFWNKLVSCFKWMTGQCSSKKD